MKVKHDIMKDISVLNAALQLLPTLAILISVFRPVQSSIHIYDRDPFREVGNAYLVSGGSRRRHASSALFLRRVAHFTLRSMMDSLISGLRISHFGGAKQLQTSIQLWRIIVDWCKS
ncbi:hypothetical protein HAX54_045164 [Datura stramonium]|uniref:Uncharacterized protein n=1 Tax=Datura stramonium TaxID=4076 RepID=A0ABS8SQR0_DATST|nr:hypothetical protein [Datura stramonium]